MLPVLSFVGKSNSGKTTLLEKLIAELTSRGHAVGLVKHTAHEVELDAKGKDTHRLRIAGASPVAIESKNVLAVFRPLSAELSLDELSDLYFTTCDILITEGFKTADAPQVLVLGSGETIPDDPRYNLFAIVSADAPPTGIKVPAFGREDIAPLADLIESRFFPAVSRSDVRVWADGKYIELNPFTKAIIGQTVKGMLSALKGGKNAVKIHIKIGR